jgi:hypothetical protein
MGNGTSIHHSAAVDQTSGRVSVQAACTIDQFS